MVKYPIKWEKFYDELKLESIERNRLYKEKKKTGSYSDEWEDAIKEKVRIERETTASNKFLEDYIINKQAELIAENIIAHGSDIFSKVGEVNKIDSLPLAKLVLIRLLEHIN